jgi:hypothetical protein
MFKESLLAQKRKVWRKYNFMLIVDEDWDYNYTIPISFSLENISVNGAGDSSGGELLAWRW